MSTITMRRRQAWIAAVKRPNITFHSIPVSMRVCSRHFHSGKPADAMYTSDPDWAPSLHLGHTEKKATETARFERQQARKRRKTETISAVDATVMTETTLDTPDEHLKHEADPGPERECDLCPKRRDEINRLLEENRALKLELGQRKMDEDALKDDDERLMYYTGLPDAQIFMSLLVTLMPRRTRSTRSTVLSPFQMLILTLMRLRLNLPMQHLAYIFSVDRTTISRTFNSMIDLLYRTITPQIAWPSREALSTTMPHQFVEAFGDRVAVILDCFEIFTERPSNLTAQSHNPTMKYLIGITPHGTISFISKGWGGSISDKHVTESCGILEKLRPRDVVLADRGFDISESVGLMCAEVNSPAVTRGHCQLETRDVESTRKIAHLRIHVKRLIGVVKNKYTMLSAKLPVSIVLPCESEDVTFLDKIVTVCCCLTNMSKSVV